MKRLTSFLGLSLLTFGVISTANAQIEWSPHMGVDYKYWGANPKAAYDPIFPMISGGVSGYLGARFYKHYNIDVGYDYGFNRSQHTTFNGNTAYFGPADAQGDSVLIRFRMKEYFVHFAYHYIFESAPCFEAFAMVGLARSEPTSTVFYNEGGVGEQLSLKVDPKWNFRYGLGLQYNFLKHLGVKASAFWEQTATINYSGTNQDNTQINFRPYRNSTNLSFGFVLFV